MSLDKDREFCNIRIICDRQVLGKTTYTNDAIDLNIIFMVDGAGSIYYLLQP